MDCKAVREKLPAFLEGDLPPGEKALVGDHVAACAACRGALEELRKAGALVRGLEEAEPPAWLKQRVMARVREEAAAKNREGFFRRLFDPLHVKVPAGVLAAALIAVLAVQVFKAVEPQVEYPGRAPAGEVRKAMPPEEKAPPAREALPPVPAPREKRAADVAERDSARDAVDVKALSREREAVAPAVPGPVAAAKREMPGETAGEPAKAKDRAGTAEPFAAGQALPRAAEEKTAAVAADRLAREEAPALAASRIGKAAPAKTGEIVFSLRADDPAGAAGEVESMLRRLGAKKVERRAAEKAWSVSAELEASRVPRFLEELKSAGRVDPTVPAASPLRGDVPVRVDISAGPEK